MPARLGLASSWVRCARASWRRQRCCRRNRSGVPSGLSALHGRAQSQPTRPFPAPGPIGHAAHHRPGRHRNRGGSQHLARAAPLADGNGSRSLGTEGGMGVNQPLDSLEHLLRGPVRWRKGLPDQGGKRRRSSLAEDLQTIARVTARTPEVMVRISGKAKGAKHVEEHLRYITRNGDLTAEDENGQLIIGRRMVKETAAAWMEGSALNRRSNSRDTVNIVLSMPPGTDEGQATGSCPSVRPRNIRR